MGKINSYVILLIGLITIPMSLDGQNLIKNGSFEDFYFCPSNFTEDNAKTFLPNWVMPTKGTPDFFNKCSKEMVGVPQNFMGNIHPFEGTGYIGLVLLDSPKDVRKEINYREYIQTSFSTSLQRNELYLIKFYYSVANYSTFSINRLGIYLSHNKINERKGVLNFQPQLIIDSLAVYFNPGEWIQFADTFRASGGENFVTIGNFSKDSKTNYIPNEISSLSPTLQEKIKTNQIAYYYIDNVSIVHINKEEYKNEFDFIQKFRPLSHYNFNELNNSLGSEIYYLLDEVYFNVQKNDFKPSSFFQTDSICSYLRKNSSKELLFKGFWFDTEKDSTAAFLRVSSLRDYLVMKGIDSKRIHIKTEKIKPIKQSLSLYDSGNHVELFTNLVAVRVLN